MKVKVWCCVGVKVSAGERVREGASRSDFGDKAF